jgi:hypothetical protein
LGGPSAKVYGMVGEIRLGDELMFRRTALELRRV